MISPLIEMLQLPNFGHMTKTLVKSWNFAAIIKIAIMFIRAPLKIQKKNKRIRNYVLQ